MDYEEYENPEAAAADGTTTTAMDVDDDEGGGEGDANNDNRMQQHEVDMIDDEDIPVTQEDAWAVIRYVSQVLFVCV
jgi:hypothetical protein